MAETLELAAGWRVLASGPCITALGGGSLGARGGEGVQVEEPQVGLTTLGGAKPPSWRFI